MEHQESTEEKDVKEYTKHSDLPLSGAERLGSLLGKVVSPI